MSVSVIFLSTLNGILTTSPFVELPASSRDRLPNNEKRFREDLALVLVRGITHVQSSSSSNPSSDERDDWREIDVWGSTSSVDCSRTSTWGITRGVLRACIGKVGTDVQARLP